MTTLRRIARVEGQALVLPGNDIDTDRIIPARFLKSITFDGLGANVFADDRRQLADAAGLHPFDAAGAADASILIAGANFGCGSSREHAPRAIAQWGIRAIVAESFAEIFQANAAAIGLPCVTISRAAAEALTARVQAAPRADVTVDLERLEICAGDDAWPIAMPAMARDAFLTGQWDATGLLVENYAEVAAAAARIPYIAGFR
jgi:3-isopropylmalate/(R)-2-methylmalate dehydratase small subunit